MPYIYMPVLFRTDSHFHFDDIDMIRTGYATVEIDLFDTHG